MGKKPDADDLVKYVAERFITYIETPKAVRRMKKQEMKQSKESWLTLWFGMLPFSFELWMSLKKSKITALVGKRRAHAKETPRDLKS